MDPNQKKEQFSKAFVCAISAQSGLNTGTFEVDDDSVDMFIKGKRFTGKFRNPQIDVQLKCTASDQGNDKFLKFPLPLKNYNDLRDTNIINPRYLFVLIVPDNCNDWLIHQDNQTILQHCCYYYSLHNQPIVNNTTSVTVSIPRSQKLNTKSMIKLLEYASNGMPLENRS